ncbi:MAG: hypothetical protein AAFU85_34250, partial [Planctomycetota bacterium]
SDDPGTPEDDSQDPHWSIEHCSLPMDEIRVYLTASLLKTDSGGTARCKVDNTASAVADGRRRNGFGHRGRVWIFRRS